MKKVVMAVIVILLAVILMGRFLVPEARDQLFICDTVSEGELQETYGVRAEVISPVWRQYFPGTITRVLVSGEDHVTKGEEVLEYLDPFGKKVKLKAERDGCLQEIGSGWVDFRSREKKISALIPQEKLEAFREDSRYQFECNGRRYSCRFLRLADVGSRSDDEVLYEGWFDIMEETDLRTGMAGRLKVTLKDLRGVQLIDERCLYSLEGKFYLLRKQWLDSFRNRERYLTEVEVLGFSEGKAAIQGIGLSSQEFVIIDDEVRSLLDD